MVSRGYRNGGINPILKDPSPKKFNEDTQLFDSQSLPSSPYDDDQAKEGNETQVIECGGETQALNFDDETQALNFNDETQAMNFNDETQAMNFNDETQAMNFNDETQALNFNDETQAMIFNDETQALNSDDEFQVMGDLECFDTQLVSEFEDIIVADSDDDGSNRTEVLDESDEISDYESNRRVDAMSSDGEKIQDTNKDGVIRSTEQYDALIKARISAGNQVSTATPLDQNPTTSKPARFTSVRTASFRAAGLAARSNINSAMVTNCQASDQDTVENITPELNIAMKSDQICENGNHSETRSRNANKTARKLFADDLPSDSREDYHDSGSIKGGDELFHFSNSDGELAGLSYVDTQEAGDSQTSNALKFVEKFINENCLENGYESQHGKNKHIGRDLKFSASLKGPRDLAKKASSKVAAGETVNFDYDLNLEDEMGDLFYRRKKDFLGPVQKSFTMPPKARGRCLGGSRYNKEQADVIMETGIHSDSKLVLHNKKMKGRKVQATVTTIKKNLEKELDKQVNIDLSSTNLKDTAGESALPEMVHVGFDTQMAAEAMEALLYGEFSPKEKQQSSSEQRCLSELGVCARHSKKTKRIDVKVSKSSPVLTRSKRARSTSEAYFSTGERDCLDKSSSKTIKDRKNEDCRKSNQLRKSKKLNRCRTTNKLRLEEKIPDSTPIACRTRNFQVRQLSVKENAVAGCGDEENAIVEGGSLRKENVSRRIVGASDASGEPCRSASNVPSRLEEAKHRLEEKVPDSTPIACRTRNFQVRQLNVNENAVAGRGDEENAIVEGGTRRKENVSRRLVGASDASGEPCRSASNVPSRLEEAKSRLEEKFHDSTPIACRTRNFQVRQLNVKENAVAGCGDEGNAIVDGGTLRKENVSRRLAGASDASGEPCRSASNVPSGLEEATNWGIYAPRYPKRRRSVRNSSVQNQISGIVGAVSEACICPEGSGLSDCGLKKSGSGSGSTYFDSSMRRKTRSSQFNLEESLPQSKKQILTKQNAAASCGDEENVVVEGGTIRKENVSRRLVEASDASGEPCRPDTNVPNRPEEATNWGMHAPRYPKRRRSVRNLSVQNQRSGIIGALSEERVWPDGTGLSNSGLKKSGSGTGNVCFDSSMKRKTRSSQYNLEASLPESKKQIFEKQSAVVYGCNGNSADIDRQTIPGALICPKIVKSASKKSDTISLPASANAGASIGLDRTPRRISTPSDSARTPVNTASPVCMGEDYISQSGKKSSSSGRLREIRSLTYAQSETVIELKDLRKRRDLSSVKVLFSHHLDDDASKQQRKILSRLGIPEAYSILHATHFVADKFVRTRNMLEAIASGKPVVAPSWLESIGQVNIHMDEGTFILRDIKKEKELGFNMAVSLAHARQRPLLQRRKVLITPNTKPGKETLSSLVKAVGGQAVERIGRHALKDEDASNDLLVLSCEEDYKICVPLLKKGLEVYSSELLLCGIVTQKLEYERHRLFADDVKRTRSTIWLRKDDGNFQPV